MCTRIVSSKKVMIIQHAKHHYCWSVLQVPQVPQEHEPVSSDILPGCTTVQHGVFMLKCLKTNIAFHA